MTVPPSQQIHHSQATVILTLGWLTQSPPVIPTSTARTAAILTATTAAAPTATEVPAIAAVNLAVLKRRLLSPVRQAPVMPNQLMLTKMTVS